MSSRFADTSYYLALLSQRDSWDTLATDLARNLRGTVVTTEFVLLELGNLLSRSSDRSLFGPLVARLRADPRAIVFPASHDWFEQGSNFYQQRPDKDWGLTDCISFVVMQQEGITEVLTADHHFEQAGFTILLK